MKEKELQLEVKDVHVNFGEIKALSGISLYIDEGEMVGLMGPNGAGKSTVIKAVFGMVPFKGEVLWHGQSIEPTPREMVERGVSMVPQGRRVFKHLSVRENLEIGAYTVRSKKEIKERVEEVFTFFPDLKKKANQSSGALSGGQQQMLAVGRGLMTDPKLLLLDEPSLGLSPKLVKEVFAKIKEINTERKTSIIVVEHNIKSVSDILDRVYILDKGENAVSGDPQEVLSGGVFEKIFLGQRK